MTTLERSIRGLGLLTAIGFVAAALTPVSNIAGGRLAVGDFIQSADAIVVLGAGSNNKQVLREESLRRIVRGVELYKKGLAPLLVVLGNPAEGALRWQFALAMGIPAGAILQVSTTTTTIEESTKTAALLRQRNARRILLVTESLHMRRAKRLFESVDLDVMPAASSHYPATMRFPAGRLWLAMRVAQEGMALIYYQVAGYI